MDTGKHPQAGRLIEQLKGVRVRQQKVIQQLQAENARLLSDLVELRQERDAFRAEVASSRRENSELQNRLDEVTTEYQDLKRERAAPLVRSASTAGVSTHGRSASKLGAKLWGTLSVLDEGQAESPTVETTTSAIKEKTATPNSRRVGPYLPDSSGLKSDSPAPSSLP